MDFINECYESFLFSVNNIINLKKAERYKVSQLIIESDQFEEILEDIISDWKLFRVALIKKRYSKNDTDILEKAKEKLNHIMKLEYLYLEKMFLHLLKQQ